MALKAVLDSLDGLHESLRGEYEPRDGKFHLKLDGDLPGYVPKARLDEFRDNNIALQRERDTLRAQAEAFKDIDPAKARDALAKLKTLDQRKLLDAGEYEKALESAKAAMAADREAALAAAAAERDTLKQNNKQLDEQIFTLTVEQNVRDVWAVPELGLEPTAMHDALDAARLAFRRDDKGRLVPHDYNGSFGAKDQVIYGPKGEPASPREWVEKMLAKRTHWKIKSSGVGDLGHPAGGGLKGEDLMKLSPVERMNRARTVRAA